MPKKTNKTAHVLNLLANGSQDENKEAAAKEDISPLSEETAAQEQPKLQKQVKSSNIMIVDSPQNPTNPISTAIKDSLDKELINMKEAGNTVEETPDRAAPAQSAGGPIDQAAIDALLKAQSNDTEVLKEDLNPVQETVDVEEPEPATGGPIDQAAIDALLKAQSGDEGNSHREDFKPAPDMADDTAQVLEPAETPFAGGSIDQAAIDALLKAQNSDDESPSQAVSNDIPAVEAAPSQETVSEKEKSIGGPISQAAIDALLNAQNPVEEEPSTTPIAAEPTEEADPGYQYVNVMEAVVDERLFEFMTKFNVCSCDRCVKDVKALAMSNMPPKYIVAETSTVKPLLSFYKSKYSSEAMTQLTKACFAVLDSPRHQS